MTSRNLTTNFFKFRNHATRDRSFHADNKSINDDAALLKSEDEDEEIVQFEKNNSFLWMESQRQMQLQFDKVRSRLKKLHQLHDKHITQPDFDENSNEEKEIETVTNDITSMLHDCHSHVQQLSLQAEKTQENVYDQRLSSNIVQASASALYDLTIKFRKCQSTYLSKLESRKTSVSHMMLDFDFDTHSNSFNDENESEQNSAQISAASQDQLQPSSYNNIFLEKRDEELQAALKTLHEINTLFREVSMLMTTQGALFDQIDYNIDHAIAQVQEGNKELVKAAERQTRFLKLKVVLLGIGLFVLFFVIFFGVIFR